jgi:glycosyltransferase involved in cell wall biosynthesis
MSQMGIFYVLNSRFPTIKAYGLQVAKTCQGLKQNGAKVRLIIPIRKRHKEIKGMDVFDLYGIKDKFRIIKLPSWDFTWLGLDNKFFFAFQQITFAWLALVYMIFKKGVIYSRDQFSLYFFSFFKNNLFWEVHRLPEHIKISVYRRLLNKLTGAVVISHGLKNRLKEYVPENKILVAPDGIDLAEFDIDKSVQDARREFNLPQDKKIVLYTGHLFEWKGADILIKAAQKLSNEILVVIVGGAQADIEKLKEMDPSRKVRIEGFKPHRLIPFYLRAADVLILPNKNDGDISEFYTSPLKLFEYMASGKPIIASDLPSISEILNEDNSFLVTANDPDALAKEIVKALDQPGQAQLKAQRALRDVQEYTWQKRGEKILNFIHGLLNHSSNI